jgi:hypothetical protein
VAALRSGRAAGCGGRGTSHARGADPFARVLSGQEARRAARLDRRDGFGRPDRPDLLVAPEPPDALDRLDRFIAAAGVAGGRSGLDTATGTGRVMRQKTRQQTVRSTATPTSAITIGPIPASCVSVTGSPERRTVVDEAGAVVVLEAGSCCGFEPEPATASRRADDGCGGEADATAGSLPRSSTITSPVAATTAPTRAATILVLT